MLNESRVEFVEIFQKGLVKLFSSTSSSDFISSKLHKHDKVTYIIIQMYSNTCVQGS